LAGGGSGGGQSAFDVMGLLLRVPGFLVSQTAACMRFMTDMVDVAKRPPEEWNAKFAVLRQQVPSLPVLVRLLAPAMDKIAQAVQRSYAQQRCAIVALAAERFRRKNNRWPASLDELKTAGLLTEIPTDPFVGGPLKWKRTENGVIIYTVGPDMTDNGGVFDRANPVKAGTDYGFQLWDVAQRRGPAPPPKKVDDEP
jgi:competence protein ComGC